MKNLDMLLLALPSVVIFGFTIYMKIVHEGGARERAITLGWTYSIIAAGFFILVYFIKFAAVDS